MADKTILTQKLIDLEGLNVFWGKTKDYIDGKITTVNDVIEENEKVTAEALTDLDSRVNTNADAISSIQQELESLSGGAGSISTQIQTAIDNLKLPETYEGKGVAQSYTDEKLGVWSSEGVTATGLRAEIENKTAENVVTMTASGDNTSDVKKYEFFQGGVSIGTINLPKDLVVASGRVVNCEVEGDNFGKKCLELTLTSGDTVHIPVTDLVDVYTGDGTYVTISDANVISVNKDKIIEGLAVANNVYSKDEANNTFVAKEGYVAYSEAEKTKLAGIAEGAQVNVIESVKVDGTALTVTDKTVNIDLSSYLKSNDQTVKSVDTTASHGVNLSNTNGTLDVVVTPGSVAEGDSSIVTGGAVHTAVNSAITIAKDYTDELGKIVKGVYDAGQLVTNGHAQRITALENISIASTEDIEAIFA